MLDYYRRMRAEAAEVGRGCSVRRRSFCGSEGSVHDSTSEFLACVFGHWVKFGQVENGLEACHDDGDGDLMG